MCVVADVDIAETPVVLPRAEEEKDDEEVACSIVVVERRIFDIDTTPLVAADRLLVDIVVVVVAVLPIRSPNVLMGGIFIVFFGFLVTDCDGDIDL